MMLAVTSCQSVKNALSGVREENSDEFLIQKKNPLVLPPDFTDLPDPFEESTEVTEVQIEEDIEKLLGAENSAENTNNTSNSSSIESFVLKKIKRDKIKLNKNFYVFTGSTVGVVTILGKGFYKGIANVGYRPTFSGNNINLEVNILRFNPKHASRNIEKLRRYLKHLSSESLLVIADEVPVFKLGSVMNVFC